MKNSAAGNKTDKPSSSSTPDDHLSEGSSSSKRSSETSPMRELRIGQMLLETTWRIAVPVILFTGIGIFVDLHVGTQPWLTFLGVIIGFILACMLIAKLLKESENL